MHLPAQPTPFVGRVEELHEISALLNDPACRLLTLVGPGGIGKTRLAVEAAAQLENTVADIFFIPLQPVKSIENIVTAIAGTLNVQLQSDCEPKQQLLRFLRDKQWLLVLDNFEHLLDATSAMLVVEILEAAPKVKLLITSREPLNLSEEWIRIVTGLDFPQSEPMLPLERYGAIRLFGECVRRVRGNFSLNDETACVLDICRLVDGVPLALELAAARLQMFPCTLVATEIRRNVEFLTTPRRNIPERHRSMRAVFEWSWGLLSAEEQAVFAALSVFQGGFTSEAAAQVAGASALMLASLAEKSLLQVDSSGRFNLHELIRQYVAEKLDEMPEIRERVLDRHCDFYTDLLHQHETTIHINSRASILKDFDNVRAAWHHAVQQRKLPALMQAATSVFWLCYLESWLSEGTLLFGGAAAVISDLNNEIEEDRFLQGMLLMYLGFFQRADPKQVEQAVLNIETGRAVWRGLAPRAEMGVPLFHAALALWEYVR
jgi:predicted ATPase